MKQVSKAFRLNRLVAERLWGRLSPPLLASLQALTASHRLSIGRGDLICLDGRWYITHSGLLRLAYSRHCSGIEVEPAHEFCDPVVGRWIFKATVFQLDRDKAFVGYGDANPSNVSPRVRGAEMRVAETRAVNRALRKAYGIGICSLEEISSLSESPQSSESKKLPAQPKGTGTAAPRLRDRLCQIIRQHQLDPTLVKAYATDFCGTATLREATREQVESFVAHLADWAERDRDALLCQLNNYIRTKQGAA